MTADVSLNHQFWADLPWYHNRAGYQLGARPVSDSDWLQPIDEAMRSHKDRVLQQRYAEAVAVSRTSPTDCLRPWLLRFDAGAAFPDDVANLAMTTQGDLCVVDLQDQQRLVAGCLCAPSYWRLTEKIDLPLNRIHAPVQGLNQTLGPRIERFLHGLPVGSPFRRRNWFVHGDGQLYHTQPEMQLPRRCEDWHVRSEQQTFYRVDQRYLLFVILVECQPLSHLSRVPAAVEGLSVTLGNMTPPQILHFGGWDKFRRLSDYVAALL